jgi:hypothetical protein
MQKYILYAAFFLMASGAFAQGFTVSNVNPKGSSGLFFPSIETRVRIKNTTSGPLSLRWTRIAKSMPAQWETAVCEDNCYGTETETRSFYLGPRQERELRVVFYPHSFSGEGTVQLALFNPADSAGTATVISFQGSNTATTGLNPMDNRGRTQAIPIFPNPPTEYFQLGENDVVSRLEVYNMVGTRVAQFTVNAPGEKYPVADLPRGLYLVRMIDRYGQIIHTQRISKYNP